jgi:glycosyltransferase involved in cell wall biosynthesis
MTEELVTADQYNTVLVVDDGSTPPLKLKFLNERIKLFRIPFNAGIGVATNIALDFGKKNNFDFFVRLDADGQHNTDYVKEIINKLMLENANICIGERSNHENMNTLRGTAAVILKRHLKLISNSVSGGSLRDWNTGIFGLDSHGMKILSRYQYDKYPEIEIYLRAHKENLVISCHEVSQLSRISGKSTLTFSKSIMLLIRTYLTFVRHIFEGNKNK